MLIVVFGVMQVLLITMVLIHRTSSIKRVILISYNNLTVIFVAISFLHIFLATIDVHEILMIFIWLCLSFVNNLLLIHFNLITIYKSLLLIVVCTIVFIVIFFI